MRRGIIALIFADLAFVLLLSLSGTGGTVGRVFYFLAFLLPFALGLLFVRKSGEELRPRLKKERLLPAVALFAPTLLIIIGLSALTSYLFSLLGKSYVTDVSGELWIELFNHALLPAVLEEMLFRFLPTRILASRSRRAAMIVSPLLFALIHMNLFRIPYALFAGAILTFITLMTGSVIPAVLLHFVNNALSVFFMRDPSIVLPMVIVLSVLSAVSLVYIFLRRRDYGAWLRESLSGERISASAELLATTAILLAAAIYNLR